MSKSRQVLNFVRVSLERLIDWLAGGRSIYHDEIEELTLENERLAAQCEAADSIVELLVNENAHGEAIVTVRVNDAFTRELIHHNVANYQLLRSGHLPLPMSFEGVEFH